MNYLGVLMILWVIGWGWLGWVDGKRWARLKQRLRESEEALQRSREDQALRMLGITLYWLGCITLRPREDEDDKET